MIYPKNSDWTKPADDYFSSRQFREDRQRIITKYLSEDATNIIDRISMSAEMGPLEEIVLSNREREAQYEQLLQAAERDKASERLNIILFGIILVAIVVLILVYALYRIKSQSADRLLQQQKIIEETNAQLLNLNEEKNNLIQVLAHDLRSPLGNIFNGSQIMQAQEELSPDGKKLLGFILESSEKMQVLIDKILDVNAIETGKHNIKRESFEIAEIVQKIYQQNESKALEKDINITTEIESDLKVTADKVYTGQVIENLVTNAIKYSPLKSQIQISTKGENKMVRISVSDQGPGLTAEDQKKLFKKYQQLSAKPTRNENTVGLGLSIVKLFTERMGGEVRYNTTIGKGTTFHILLPRT